MLHWSSPLLKPEAASRHAGRPLEPLQRSVAAAHEQFRLSPERIPRFVSRSIAYDFPLPLTQPIFSDEWSIKAETFAIAETRSRRSRDSKNPPPQKNDGTTTLLLRKRRVPFDYRIVGVTTTSSF